MKHKFSEGLKNISMVQVQTVGVNPQIHTFKFVLETHSNLLCIVFTFMFFNHSLSKNQKGVHTFQEEEGGSA